MKRCKCGREFLCEEKFNAWRKNCSRECGYKFMERREYAKAQKA